MVQARTHYEAKDRQDQTQNKSRKGKKAKFYKTPIEPSEPTSPQSFPYQYPNKVANKVEQVTEDTVTKHITHLTIEECANDFLTDDEQEKAGFITISTSLMACTTTIEEEPLEVMANLEYALKTYHTQKVYAISDRGADLCITGQNAGW